MSLLLLPEYLSRQPAGFGRLSQSNPLAEGIIFCAHGGAQGFDLVGKNPPSIVSSSVAYTGSGRHGRGMLYGTSGYNSYPNADALILGNGYTVLTIARSTSLAAQSGLTAKWDNATGNNVPMTFFSRSSGEIALWRNVGGGNNGSYGTTTTMGGTTGQSVISVNKDFIASVDAGSTVHSVPNIYVDGSLRNSGWTFGPAGSNVALVDSVPSTFSIGSSNGGFTTWQGVIYLTVIWNRRLSAAEHLQLHNNPWQLFEDYTLPYFVSSGGDLTLTVTQGTLTLTGQSVGMNFTLAATNGSLGLTGQAEGMNTGLTLAHGSLTLTGQTIGLAVGGNLTLVADNGSLTLTGQNVGMNLGMPVTNGAAALSGQSVGMNRSLVVANGSLTLTGQVIGMDLGGDLILSVTEGQLTLLGQSIGLSLTGVGNPQPKLGDYRPDPVFFQVGAVENYTIQELEKVSRQFELGVSRTIEFLAVPPPKPFEGMVRGANGSSWDPGSGKGVYVYYSGNWHFLG